MSTSQYSALLLNADFTPMSVAPLSVWGFERTLRNVLKERVIVLEEHDILLRSPSFAYKPPAVVALKEYVKTPKRVVFSRMNIFLRDNFTCQYCNKKFSSSTLTFDHVVPRAKGGKTSFTNIVSACVTCNARKGSSTFMKPIKEPIEPSFYALNKTLSHRGDLHKSWKDYLYWSGVLQQD